MLGSSRPPEALRDQHESEFTVILRRLWRSVPNVLAAAFVDREGECIDYVSSVDPFEAKVAGAHMEVMLGALQQTQAKLSTGEAYGLEILTDTHELWGRRISEEYVVVVLLTPECDRTQLRLVLRQICAAFRDEVGLPAPGWDMESLPLRVSVRPAAVWPYAPEVFWRSDERVDVSDVLGRWYERHSAAAEPHARICFRVRTVSGQELTLVHHVQDDDWSLRV